MGFLEESEQLWKVRHTYRQARLNYWARRGDPIQVDKWEGLRDEASYWLRKRRGQIDAKRDSLSPNFNVSEFDCHNGQEVPEKSIPALKILARGVLEPLRKKYGEATVNSGYRPRGYNKSIGGAPASHHIYELYNYDAPAADVRFAKGTPAQWAASARALRKGGVGQYDRANFVHVDLGPVRSWQG